jgi:hypothetical protein
MEIYKAETRKVITHFLHYKISFGGCVHALDAARSSLMVRMSPEDSSELRAVILTNNQIVMKEMERRSEMAKPKNSASEESK